MLYTISLSSLGDCGGVKPTPTAAGPKVCGSTTAQRRFCGESCASGRSLLVVSVALQDPYTLCHFLCCVETAVFLFAPAACCFAEMPVSRSTLDERYLDNIPPLNSELICYALRLRPGAELKGALAELTSAKMIKAGFIITCVGSVRDVSLRLAGAERPSSAAGDPSARQADCPATPRIEDQQQQLLHPRPHHQSQIRQSTDQEQQPMLHTGPDARFEICSLVGTLSPGGLHLHASLADEAGAICGGYLVRATVHTTAEIVIGVAPSLIFRREMDSSTGFKELVVARPDVNYETCFLLFILVILMMVLLLHSR